MNGNLEPEERVYDCAVQAQGKWLGQLAIALESLGWDRGDNVAEIAAPQSMRLMVLVLMGTTKRHP